MSPVSAKRASTGTCEVESMPATKTNTDLPPWGVLPPEARPAGVPTGALHLRPARRGHLWWRGSEHASAVEVWLAPYDGSVAKRATDADYELAPEPAQTNHNSGPRARKEGRKMAATKTRKPPSPLKALVADGSDLELAAHLLKTPTIPDRAWESRQGRKRRRDGESRADFIVRTLGDPDGAASAE